MLLSKMFLRIFQPGIFLKNKKASDSCFRIRHLSDLSTLLHGFIHFCIRPFLIFSLLPFHKESCFFRVVIKNKKGLQGVTNSYRSGFTQESTFALHYFLFIKGAVNFAKLKKKSIGYGFTTLRTVGLILSFSSSIFNSFFIFSLASFFSLQYNRPIPTG